MCIRDSQSLIRDFSEPTFQLEQRRLMPSDFEGVTALHERDVFMCGPDALMTTTEETLRKMGVDNDKIHRESFVF